VAEYQLDVELREGSRKSAARRLRASGRIPGICYGRDTDAVSVSLDPRALERLISTSEAGMNTLIDLRAAGDGNLEHKKVLLKELQRDPLSGQPLHVDFYAVDLEKTVTVSVPVHLVGTAHGVTMGGILDHSLREIEFECLPAAIPREIKLDVSALDIGQSVHVRDVPLPEGVELLSDPDLSILSVMMPAVAEEPTAEVEAEAVAEGEAAPEGAEPEGEAAEKPAEDAKSD
jgi:large subunit ribosomal protein L25